MAFNPPPTTPEIEQFRSGEPAHRRGVRETRNRMMKMDQVLGMPLKDIAKKYNVTMPECRKGLSEAHKAGVLEAIEAGVLVDLMPKAMAVLEAHLAAGESLKAVELTLALFGATKAKIAPAKGSVEVTLPGDGRAVGIVALDQIRQERTINAEKRERYDGRPESHGQSGADRPRTLPGFGGEPEPFAEGGSGGG